MKIRHFISATVILGTFIFPQKVSSESICFFSDTNLEKMSFLEYSFCGDFKNDEKEFILLNNLFDNDKKVIQCIPEGVKVLYTKVLNDELIFNVSGEIKSFGGGSAYEICLLKQILGTVFQVDGINKVTMFIDGNLNYLPEGSIINKYTKERFEKDMKGD